MEVFFRGVKSVASVSAAENDSELGDDDALEATLFTPISPRYLGVGCWVCHQPERQRRSSTRAKKVTKKIFF